MILRAIFSHKDLQTPTNLFLASLAVADLLITLSLPLYSVGIQSLMFSFNLILLADGLYEAHLLHKNRLIFFSLDQDP